MAYSQYVKLKGYEIFLESWCKKYSVTIMDCGLDIVFTRFYKYDNTYECKQWVTDKYEFLKMPLDGLEIFLDFVLCQLKED